MNTALKATLWFTFWVWLVVCIVAIVALAYA